MSLQTWKAEFYSKPALTMVDSSWSDCLDHSICKWEGLLPENLAKHDVSLLHGSDGGPVVMDDDEEEEFEIDSFTCALCEKADWCATEESAGNMCDYCPLAKSLGMSCSPSTQEGIYDEFYTTLNPVPMLEAIKNARAQAQS